MPSPETVIEACLLIILISYKNKLNKKYKKSAQLETEDVLP